MQEVGCDVDDNTFTLEGEVWRSLKAMISCYEQRIRPSFSRFDRLRSSTSLTVATLVAADVEANIVRCPDQDAAGKMLDRIDAIRKTGNSVGGVVTCVARNVPSGLGSPVFDKLEADLAKACMSLPACKGFEVGSGFQGTMLTGKEVREEAS